MRGLSDLPKDVLWIILNMTMFMNAKSASYCLACIGQKRTKLYFSCGGFFDDKTIGELKFVCKKFMSTLKTHIQTMDRTIKIGGKMIHTIDFGYLSHSCGTQIKPPQSSDNSA